MLEKSESEASDVAGLARRCEYEVIGGSRGRGVRPSRLTIVSSSDNPRIAREQELEARSDASLHRWCGGSIPSELKSTRIVYDVSNLHLQSRAKSDFVSQD